VLIASASLVRAKARTWLRLPRLAPPGTVPAQIGVVLSDVPDAGILNHAQRFGVPFAHIAPGKYRTKLDDDSELAYIQRLTEAKVDLIVLAGFMRILKGEFLKAFANRVVNIHPSLLPAFPGLEAWKQALDHGVKVTGCTVHFVDQGVDSERGQKGVSPEYCTLCVTLSARLSSNSFVVKRSQRFNSLIYLTLLTCTVCSSVVP
jgi:hypothetical protein